MAHTTCDRCGFLLEKEKNVKPPQGNVCMKCQKKRSQEYSRKRGLMLRNKAKKVIHTPLLVK